MKLSELEASGKQREAQKKAITYRQAGVDTDKVEEALQGLTGWVRRSFDIRKGIGAPVLSLGHFANVVDLGEGEGLAITTDGVGTKVLVAQLKDKYDTVGIDCVAMNVNDLLAVGAEPLSMVDYIAVEEGNSRLIEELGRGLYEGAKRANITLVGGEIAQLGEIIKGLRPGFGFDLTGTAIGKISLGRIISGKNLQEGDVIVGLESSGLHSNGFTLARKVLLDEAGLGIADYIQDLQAELGEELLKPTRIYVPEVVAMLNKGIKIKGLAHVTGDGFLNLVRGETKVSYIIDNLPESPPIFSLIQSLGKVKDEEMFRVFNMGVGFCIIAPKEEEKNIIKIAEEHGTSAQRIGSVTEERPCEILITQKNLLGKDGKFKPLQPR